ncbi:GH36-type glycosyl hydrolase domain-containing protein [Hymenobacter terrenus]|uniref:GH36-type glycosyl hydrolase domain-containing protein n=1 Tax=Hymenobacter terrenus TaxID=1629124 RepID=UPI000AA76620|nr:hypothetical protein [Hymenobacter terrenus]
MIDLLKSSAAKAIIFLVVALGLPAHSSFAQSIGSWSFSAKGLPVYQYKGPLPFKAVDKEGEDALQPEDPYFLLGNYRMTLITHASGIYQLLTAERAWARLNAAERPNYGWNEASIVFKNGKANQKVVLTGVKSLAANQALAQKDFGVGFARYAYKLNNDLQCTRILSTKPSEKINTGNPAFVVTVILKNNGKTAQQLSYYEKMRVHYVLNSTQYTEKEKRPLTHDISLSVDNKKEIAIATTSTKANKFLVLPPKEERYVYDVAPPSVFMYFKNSSVKQTSEITATKDTLAAEINLTLKAGETKSFHLVIGIADGQQANDVQKQVDDLFVGADLNNPVEGLLAAQWKKRLPNLAGEKNEILRREMLWNAHMIEASAKYSDYYKETFIPQGSVYSYFFGDNISNRDHLQAALPACYTNPELAKSTIKYVIKHSESDGEIKRGNYSGYGYTPPSLYKESDPQLYVFNTVSEYLLITKDYNFLNEKVDYFPAEYGKKDPVIIMLKKYFIYLRDEVGTGPNGLVKILNSDWSDSFFHKYSPNKYSWTAESHLNSAMVLAVFPKLIEVLKQSKNPEASSFVTVLEEYRAAIEAAFMKDLGDRKFAPRAYLDPELHFGTDVVCIEPQGYVLQIPGLPKERKKEMYAYIKSKILAPEKIGARTREKPLWDKDRPGGEDGGIWFSLEYPLLLGVATFDKEEARAMLLKFSFENYAKQYPNYWVGQWTAADEVNSTLYREGLYQFWVGVPNLKEAFQGYCSHPHTWPLFCYFKLRE